MNENDEIELIHDWADSFRIPEIFFIILLKGDESK
jgi:hypothetical protein